MDAALAVIERDASVRWRAEPGPDISRTDRVVGLAEGALPLIVARSRIGDVDDAGVTLGVGDPASCVAWFPGCGCDACDSGSQDELDELDRHVAGIVSGSFRRLTDGERQITVLDEHGWSASGLFRPSPGRGDPRRPQRVGRTCRHLLAHCPITTPRTTPGDCPRTPASPTAD